jgi:hypothetical protein
MNVDFGLFKNHVRKWSQICITFFTNILTNEILTKYALGYISGSWKNLVTLIPRSIDITKRAIHTVRQDVWCKKSPK